MHLRKFILDVAKVSRFEVDSARSDCSDGPDNGQEAKPNDLRVIFHDATPMTRWPRHAPDDSVASAFSAVLVNLSTSAIAVERYLGKSRLFWAWLLEQWERLGVVTR